MAAQKVVCGLREQSFLNANIFMKKQVTMRIPIRPAQLDVLYITNENADTSARIVVSQEKEI